MSTGQHPSPALEMGIGYESKESATRSPSTPSRSRQGSQDQAAAVADDEANVQYPHGLKLALIMVAVMASVFLVALV